MRLLRPGEREDIEPLLGPARAGPQVARHVLSTGHGAVFADRWPDARALFSVAGPNYSLAGDPGAFGPDALRPFIAGMVDCDAAFEPLLDEILPAHAHWPRVISQLSRDPLPFARPDAEVRGLQAADAHHVYGLSDSNLWIAETWGGPQVLCASGRAWGAFVDGRLVSIAVSFYAGDAFEDIGVVTEPGFRGRGLSLACAGSLCRDIRARGHTPSWSTSPDNEASLRVGEKLGFVHARDDLLHVIGDEIPEPARAPQS